MPKLSEYLSLIPLFKEKIKQVYTYIEGEVNNDITLSELDNISKTSPEGLMLYWPSYISWFFEEFTLKEFKKDIVALIDANTSQTDPWWSTEMKKFQDGDPLLWNPDTKKYYYATIDTSKQIIKYCSVTSAGGVCTVKVAKSDRTKLTSLELSRAIAYGDRVQPAGANIEYLSIDPDLLKCGLSIYFDPLLEQDDVKTAVEAAINAYIEQLNTKGEFSINDLEAAIRLVPGVQIIKRGLIETKAAGGTYLEVTDIVYQTFSGFLVVDPLFPLEDTVSYVANNG